MDKLSTPAALQGSTETSLASSSKIDSLLEVDHLFICIAEEVDISVLQEAGLRCSNYTVRRGGQGTASRLILFENAYLELIFVEDEGVAAQTSQRTGIDLLARSHWQHTHCSPFGVGLRRKSNMAHLAACFQQSRIEPIPRDPQIHFATDNRVNQAEPLCFLIPDCIAFTQWLDPTSDAHQYLLTHPLGINQLTDINITIDSTRTLTPTIAMLSQSCLVSIEQGMVPLLELVFDAGKQAQRLDLRPRLPVLLRY
ncbi:MAG TPA: hypothetical protein ACFE0H_00845 [Elainellaceae cyanobacterium]|jgi:hypothetical protein